MAKKRPLIERFVAKIKPGPNCWEWTGKPHSHGYGAINSGEGSNTMLLAHRVSYEIFVGPIPSGLHICHHCDNKLCVRPSHLFVGTNVDNHIDAQLKGRLRGPVKFNAPAIKMIRKLYGTGEHTMVDLAKRFHMSPANIYKIVRFKSRMNIPTNANERLAAFTHICQKINENICQEIHRRYQAGERPVDLAKEFNITPTRIVEIGKHGYFGKGGYRHKPR